MQNNMLIVERKKLFKAIASKCKISQSINAIPVSDTHKSKSLYLGGRNISKQLKDGEREDNATWATLYQTIRHA